MARLLRVSDRHQITLPSMVLKDAGIAEGAYLSVVAKDGKIILEPKRLEDDPLAGDDLELLDKLVKRELKSGRSTQYSSPKAARKHLDRYK
jgi:AbrB family looped-hinge helix DNA binding protein